MEIHIYLFLGQCIIFFGQYGSIYGKALIGNVTQARPGDFPYIVSIMRKNRRSRQSGGDHFCTGALITRQDILTAEHCIDDERLTNVQVVVETIDIRDGRILYPFWWQSYDQWAITHNVTIDFHMNDLANIRLLRKVSSSLLPVRISSLSNRELFGAHAVIGGWGVNNQGRYPDIMLLIKVQVLENYVCETRLQRTVGPENQINERMLCSASEPYALIENGDSGGPLLFRNRLIGINKATCPGDSIPDKNVQMNLHMGLQHYREYIKFIKNL